MRFYEACLQSSMAPKRNLSEEDKKTLDDARQQLQAMRKQREEQAKKKAEADAAEAAAYDQYADEDMQSDPPSPPKKVRAKPGPKPKPKPEPKAKAPAKKRKVESSEDEDQYEEPAAVLSKVPGRSAEEEAEKAKLKAQLAEYRTAVGQLKDELMYHQLFPAVL